MKEEAPRAESIGSVGRTEGTETSQYLEAEEINRDSESSGERNRRSLHDLASVPSRTVWKGRPQRVIAPYAKGALAELSVSEVGRDTWNPV